MSDNNKYDALKEIFRRKLENHQAPVDSSDWEIINRRLHGQSSSKKKLIAMWSAVAASLAILLTLAYLHNDREFGQQLPNNPALVENFSEHTEPTPPVSTIPAQKIQVNKNSHKKNVKIGTPEKNVMPETNDTIMSDKQESTAVSRKEPEKEPEKQSTGKQTDEPQNNMLFTVDYPSHIKKEKKGLLLAASFGTSHSMGINSPAQYPQYDVISDGYTNTPSGNKNSLSYNGLIPENLEGEYLPPLSFGLSVRKNLDAHWGIETGLVYTYLSSNYRWNYREAFDATQQLHYLGVPLNGVFYLWNNNPRWNVYLSAGTMLEKGLWMKTVRNQHFTDHTATTTQKNAIAGWQWSLNSSLGLSYRFTKKMEFYVEPRFSYYFDNDHPASIRTDRPVSIGVGGGLQYSF